MVSTNVDMIFMTIALVCLQNTDRAGSPPVFHFTRYYQIASSASVIQYCKAWIFRVHVFFANFAFFPSNAKYA